MLEELLAGGEEGDEVVAEVPVVEEEVGGSLVVSVGSRYTLATLKFPSFLRICLLTTSCSFRILLLKFMGVLCRYHVWRPK